MQLAFGLAGAAIGSTGVFGGVAGMLGMTSMGFGWTLGQWVGGLFGSGGSDTTQDGPRLSDLKVTNSAYGTGIPVVYGTLRLSGNIIDSTDKIEHKQSHTQSSGGKGGGGSSQTYNEYTYSISVLIGLCEGPITGVKRIWFNNKLVYDAGSTEVTSIAASSLNASNVTIYTGTETQSPDPTFEAIRGVGNCPAYRGLAYLSIANLQLKDYGNALPNIEVEVVCNGTQADGIRRISDQLLPASVDIFGADHVHPPLIYGADVGVVYIKSKANKSELGTEYGKTILGFTNDGYASQEISREPISVYSYSDQWMTHAAMPGSIGWNTDAICLGAVFTGAEYSPYSFLWTMEYGVRQIGQSQKIVTVEEFANTYNYNTLWTLDEVLIDAGETGRFLLGCIVTTDRNAVICLTAPSADSAPDKFFKLMANEGEFYIANSGSVTGMSNKSRFLNYSNSIGTWAGYANGAATGSGTDGWAMVSSDGYGIWEVDNQFTPAKIKKYSIQGNRIVFDKETTVDSYYTPTTIWASGSILTGIRGWINDNTLRVINFTDIPSMTSNTVSLASIVADLCNKSGLGVTDYDVSTLTHPVDGIAISRPTTARGVINTLQQAYFFDMVESDNKLKCVTRGQSPIAEFLEDDLAAHDATSGSTSIPDQVKMTRAQEMELPYEVNVTYMSKNQNYQEGTQYDRRLNTQAVNVASTQLPMSLDDTHAKNIASVGLFNAWQERMTFQFTTSRKYAHIEPTDVCYLNKNGNKYAIRIVKKTDKSDGTIDWSAVREDIAVYTQNGVASTSTNTGSQTVDYAYPLLSYPFETVPLRDSDASSPVYYLATSSSNENGGSGMVYESIDNGVTWDLKTQASGQCGVGVITNALTTPNTFNDVDWSQKAVIKIQPWITLSSCSYFDIINQKNFILIGDEIVQYMNAYSSGNGVWELTGLLRGLKGTDIYANHSANERVILLDPNNLRKVEYPTDQISTTRLVTSVSWGGSTNTSRKTVITPTAKNIKPLAPCNLSASRNTNTGDWYINWFRRARKAGSWVNGQDVPLDETTESYKVRIYTDSTYSTIKNTYTTSTNSLTYTINQQNSDIGGSSQAGYNNLYYSVCQVGANGDSPVQYGSASKVFKVAFNDVYLASSLLHMNQTSGSTTFTDEYGAVAWTVNNVSTTNAYSYYGTNSAVFDGSTSYLDRASSTSYAGDKPWTIELLVRPGNTAGVERVLVDTRTGVGVGGNYPTISLLPDNRVAYFKTRHLSATPLFVSSEPINDNTWNHIAYTWDGSKGYLFVNGDMVASGADTGYPATMAVRLGAYKYSNSLYFNGHMNGFCWTKSAKYLSDFIVDTTPIGKYVFGFAFDNGITVEVTGKTPTANNGTLNSTNYVYGGYAANFASGQYLQMTNTTDMNIGTQDFCFEAWAYITANSPMHFIFDAALSTNAATGFGFVILNSSNAPMMLVNGNNVTTAGTGVTLNAWNHIAFARQGTTLRIFLGGVLNKTVTGFNTNLLPQEPVVLANSTNASKTNWPLAGILDGVRLVTGRAVYTSDFTPTPNTIK
jgi:hypothetical protein